MIEQNQLCHSRNDDNKLEQESISWQDLRGLGWIFCYDAADYSDEKIKTYVACA